MSLPGNIGLLSRLPSAQSAGYGNVDGPASATDYALAAFNGTTGKLIRNTLLGTDASGNFGIATAASTGQRIKLFSSTVVTTPVEGTWWTSATAGMFGGFTEGTGSGAGDWVFSHAGASSASTNIVGRASRGTLAVPTISVADDSAIQMVGSWYDGAAFRNTASVQLNVDGTVSSGVAPGSVLFSTGETTGRTATAQITAKGQLRTGIIGRTTSAWGSTGIVQFSQASQTFTDSSTTGSGTAATAVFSSFATPTLAATNATVTTTDAATLYIAGAPANGTNMTITNPYALWIDAGDIRYDGTVSASVAVASTNKIRINANGTVYYLLMTTVP